MVAYEVVVFEMHSKTENNPCKIKCKIKQNSDKSCLWVIKLKLGNENKKLEDLKTKEVKEKDLKNKKTLKIR